MYFNVFIIILGTIHLPYRWTLAGVFLQVMWVQPPIIILFDLYVKKHSQ